MNPSEVATTVAHAARDHQFAEIAALFKPVLRAQVSPAILQAAWVAETDRIGRVTGIGDPSSEPLDPELLRVSVPIQGERGGVTLVVSVDQDGHLNGLRLATDETWNPPEYADPTSFEERDITIGSGTQAVEGTLSIPDDDGAARIGVVLLSGGGPFDRDGTSGPNKPLKDLAWGLASRGIAVLRFDKITSAQPDLTSQPDFTMTDEYVPHALAAIDLLTEESTVDRVFVVGHSMGGKVAPRVAAASDSVAGLVILAGDTQPMQHAAVRVARYLASVDPSEAATAFVETLVEQAKSVDSPDLSASTPAADLPFGFSGSYWLDLREYDPVATAAALDKPILILQGGRDYQVTVADDLPGWQAGLADRSDVTINVLEADDHFFFPGSGPSTMSDYNTAQHVDPAVIDNITTWLS